MEADSESDDVPCSAEVVKMVGIPKSLPSEACASMLLTNSVGA